MKTVENGSAVKLHYKGTFPDGEVFDDSRERGETLELLVGAGRLLKGFETALVGMSTGETKTITLTSEEAYGPINEAAIVEIPKKAFPEDFIFQEGITVQGTNRQGTPMLAKIVKFDDDSVTLDHNHPLAGKDINFEIELVEIESKE
jgi:peptidylprolyl isomerase